MFYSGITDEAGASIDTQIQATLELGWHHFELRKINSGNLASISEAEFEYLEDCMNKNNIKLSAFSSGIANWQCHPRSDEDFEKNLTELKLAIPRMQKLGTKFVRGMSYLVPKDEQFDSPELESIIFAKVKKLVNICEENGIIYAHENCMNYAGQSYKHTLKLIEAVNSKAFTLIFDTGNPVFNFNRIGEQPYKLQNAFEFYSNVKEFISYVHIKDATSKIVKENEESETIYTYAGEGDACVKEIITDLLKSGYDGCFSIEPHIATVFHAKEEAEDAEQQAKYQYDSYIKYGKSFEELMNKLRSQI